jgi:hypothetical protein
MSDEPKKQTRSWIGWVMVAVLMLYPLSMPPALRWTISHGHVRPVYKFYKPLMSVARLPVLKEMMSWYSSLWGMGWDPD